MKLSKRAQKLHEAWTARVEAEGLTVGKRVMVMRVTTDARDYILNKWWEPATITEIRNFDALARFDSDQTLSSTGLGLAEIPAHTNPAAK